MVTQFGVIIKKLSGEREEFKSGHFFKELKVTLLLFIIDNYHMRQRHSSIKIHEHFYHITI